MSEQEGLGNDVVKAQIKCDSEEHKSVKREFSKRYIASDTTDSPKSLKTGKNCCDANHKDEKINV